MTDLFRKNYRKLSPDEQLVLTNLKTQAEMMAHFIEKIPEGRERSLAMTKLEESVMWATKAVTE